MTVMPGIAATIANTEKVVVFVPVSKTMPNPYLRELDAHLGDIGIKVVLQSTLKGLVWDVLRRPGSISVIHMHWLPHFEAHLRDRVHARMWMGRIRVLRWLGCDFVWTVHNLYHHEASGKTTDRWVARRMVAIAKKVIVHSMTARRLVAEEFEVADQNKLVVVPHANYVQSYDNTISRRDARVKLGVPQEACLFLFLGHIRPYKGVMELMQAYRKLGDSGASLIVAGKPFNEDFASKIEEAAGTDHSVRLRLSLIPDDEIQIYMNACDVVVFPYREILTSGAVVLAMSFGRPCIAPKLGCIPDILDDEGAFLYDPDDENGLESALRRATERRAELESMGDHNLEQAKNWDWKTIALQTARCYDGD